VGFLQEPQLLVVTDVSVVPYKRAHYGILLDCQVLLGDTSEQEPRPLPRFLEPFDDYALVRPAFGSHEDRCYSTPSPRQGCWDEGTCSLQAVGVR
jgi:hypothetical protein